jgi:hypothetical protein
MSFAILSTIVPMIPFFLQAKSDENPLLQIVLRMPRQYRLKHL